ncbi:MAG: hypothetical protein Q8P18_27965 [Pseudomonadota bacterium]|nr:hypothetical protein [Pseudomonadota bacterium]
MNARSILTGLVIFGLGMASTYVIPAARAGAGGWQCYVVDRMPDMKSAAEWKGAVNYTTGLNEVAANAPAGTILNGTYPTSGGMYGSGSSGAPILCVKN